MRVFAVLLRALPPQPPHTAQSSSSPSVSLDLSPPWLHTLPPSLLQAAPGIYRTVEACLRICILGCLLLHATHALFVEPHGRAQGCFRGECIIWRLPLFLLHIQDGGMLGEGGKSSFISCPVAASCSGVEMPFSWRNLNCALYRTNFMISPFRCGVILGGYSRFPLLPSR